MSGLNIQLTCMVIEEPIGQKEQHVRYVSVWAVESLEGGAGAAYALLDGVFDLMHNSRHG